MNYSDQVKGLLINCDRSLVLELPNLNKEVKVVQQKKKMFALNEFEACNDLSTSIKIYRRINTIKPSVVSEVTIKKIRERFEGKNNEKIKGDDQKIYEKIEEKPYRIPKETIDAVYETKELEEKYQFVEKKNEDINDRNSERKREDFEKDFKYNKKFEEGSLLEKNQNEEKSEFVNIDIMEAEENFEILSDPLRPEYEENDIKHTINNFSLEKTQDKDLKNIDIEDAKDSTNFEQDTKLNHPTEKSQEISKTEEKIPESPKIEEKIPEIPKIEEKDPEIPKIEEKNREIPKTEEKNREIPKTEEKNSEIPKTEEKKSLDPGQPKPLSPFQQFLRVKKPELLSQNPSLKYKDIVLIVSQLWKEISESEKKLYESG